MFYFLIESVADYFPVTNISVIFDSSNRTKCFLTQFYRDNIYEDTESYAFDLILEGSTTHAMVHPNVSEIFLLDQNGMNLYYNMITSLSDLLL